MTGLRQLQRQRVREAISAAAISLFLERGFDEVPVTEVAAAARVSKPTLFKYFPTKEDLVLHRIADHQGEAARVVRERAPGVDPVTALHRHFLDALARHDPVTGLNDHPEVLGYHRMVFFTPSLASRVFHYMSQDEAALAEALGETTDELTAGLLAGQVLAVQRVLSRRTWQALADGRPFAEVEAEAVRAADHAFSLLKG
ncbi:TetR/AcrR family transcriptional regulator [Nonomuraea cavernae]|uniref:TetR family transcriptional regulator n=1 Tax=Nonomuraea cavernae TaxID=2045107 RepID=A0A917YPS7_9ACTN|nr:TetR family transcriptional regulator [Nonomuraea cavernae]MCA2184528.1 TetR/AcrR family transcriptional regulator [Nonomuraea cavernae]GGO63516.1 TetR family transcriptional regulator [Nonomuraea cavernae]